MDNKNLPVHFNLNSKGDQIVEEKIDGGGKTQVIKFGLIRLMNEKQERRVAFKTLLDINKAQKANFSGKINIPEINMSVYASQIVMTRSEVENIRTENSFTNLPTEIVYLDENFNRLSGIRPRIEREHDLYYIATCHYVVDNGERQYYLEPHQIQYLLTMVRDEDPDYPHYAKQVLRYGRDVREIEKEQNKKK